MRLHSSLPVHCPLSTVHSFVTCLALGLVLAACSSGASTGKGGSPTPAPKKSASPTPAARRPATPAPGSTPRFVSPTPAPTLASAAGVVPPTGGAPNPTAAAFPTLPAPAAQPDITVQATAAAPTALTPTRAAVATPQGAQTQPAPFATSPGGGAPARDGLAPPAAPPPPPPPATAATQQPTRGGATSAGSGQPDPAMQATFASTAVRATDIGADFRPGVAVPRVPLYLGQVATYYTTFNRGTTTVSVLLLGFKDTTAATTALRTGRQQINSFLTSGGGQRVDAAPNGPGLGDETLSLHVLKVDDAVGRTRGGYEVMWRRDRVVVVVLETGAPEPRTIDEVAGIALQQDALLPFAFP